MTRPGNENGGELPPGSDGSQMDSGSGLNESSVIRLPRQRDPRSVEIELHETVHGSKPGRRFVRRSLLREQKLRRVGEGEFEATQAALTPASRGGKLWAAPNAGPGATFQFKLPIEEGAKV